MLKSVFLWILSTSASTAIVVFVLWLLKETLITGTKKTVEKAIESRFDAKLETLRSELRKSETRFQEELTSKEREIEAIRSGAMSGLISRNALLAQKRVEAVDKVWATVIEMQKLLPVVHTMQHIKFEAAAKLAQNNSQKRETFKQFFQPYIDLRSDTTKGDSLAASQVRPYVPENLWLHITAYRHIITYSFVQMLVIAHGVGSEALDPQIGLGEVRKAAPQFSAYIDKYGPDGLAALLPLIEDLILQGLRDMLDGRETDKATVMDADTIAKLARERRQNVLDSSQVDGLGEQTSKIPEEIRAS